MNIARKHKNRLWISLLLASPMAASAQEAQPSGDSYFSNALFMTLLVTAILLLIMIVALANVLKNLADSDLINKLSEKQDKRSQGPKITFLLLFLAGGYAMQAAEVVSVPVPDDGRIGGLDPFTFYFMLVLIAGELIVAGILFRMIRGFLALADNRRTAEQPVKPKEKPILDKLNAAVEIDQEEAILLDHDYDGIRELDNNLPPWWKYGFYLTIIVACLYLINYHVLGTSPLQKEEYVQSVQKAEAEIAEYMKNSANNVDESTVTMMTSEVDLAEGKDLFVSNCAACHGRQGEGGVGPNLTDDYWLHSGGIRDVFKSIKYGWTDKGMKAWKEDFSPVQIAQLASYIKSIRGSHPPKAKEPQGELYAEASVAGADSLSVVKKDTLH